MAKQSGYPSGAPAQAADVLNVARAGATYRLTLTEVLALGASGAPSRNLLINGFPDVWTRGTSFVDQKTTGAVQYAADRWLGNRAGNATGQNISRYIITSADRTDAARSLGRYGLKWQRAAGNADVAGMFQFYALTTDDSLPLAGQPLTLTIVAKKGANYSGGNVNIALSYGTGTDQREYAMTGLTFAATTVAALTTAAQSFSCSATIPVTATQVGVQMSWTPAGTAGVDDSVYILAAILQVGNGTAPVRVPLIDEEEAICRRYYREIGAGGQLFEAVGIMESVNTTTGYMALIFEEMRVAPAVTVSAAGDFQTANGAIAATNFSASQISRKGAFVTWTFAGGLTAASSYVLRANNTLAARIYLNSEL